MTHSPSRRQILKAMATSAALPLAGPLWADEARKPASDRINLGFIGVGVMGRGHLGSFLGMGDVQVVAVCDVVAQRLDHARKMVETRYGKDKKGEFKGCAAFKDFRDLLAVKGLDAVLIATPDHWHVIPCILAARAGKHIYCEKPLTHDIAEGRRLVKEVSRSGITFQTGSQQRSEFGNHFRLAVELVRNGRIGKVQRINIGVGEPARQCDLPTQEVPEGTDWDFWLGPAASRGYNEILCPKGVHNHFPAWRNYREFGGGGLADMGAHHFDIAQWALNMDNSGPTKIVPPEKGNSGLRFVYANGVEMVHGGNVDCEFIGDRGIVRASRGGIQSDPAEIMKAVISDSDFHVYPSNNHRRNWIECIRNGKQTICPAGVGHRSATVCHLGNIGYRLRRSLTWDPVKETFANDTEANKLTRNEPRAMWRI